MANKFFKNIQTLRKNVKKLPKKLEDAFTITQEDNIEKIFIVNEIQHTESEDEYNVSFVEKCNVENDTPLTFNLTFTKDEFDSACITKGFVLKKEMMVFVTELCPPLVTIGKILEQNVLPEKKYCFVTDMVFEKQVTKYKTITLEEYKNDLISTLTVFKKKVKTL